MSCLKKAFWHRINKSLMTLILMFIAGAWFSCSVQRPVPQPVFTEDPSGFSYLITERGQGEVAAINDVVKVHYTLMLEDSTIIDNSHERGEPISFKLGSGQVIKGWEMAMTRLRKNDKATIIIPPDLGYGDQQVGTIPAGSTLYFDVEIVDIIRAPEQYAVEEKEVVETQSGLKYAIVEKGDGVKLQNGMRVKVHYSGYFEDMTMFDSSHERQQPIEITLGRGMVIRGWDEGLGYLNVGDKARLWIPYQLAYGVQGRGPIPPRSNLIFDVEVLEAVEIPGATPFNTAGKDTLETESGIRYIIIEEGTGDKPERGSIVNVHYSGYLTDGTLFDSSVERGQPFRFVIGQGQVIPGWDEGVALMRAGAKYRLIIPAELGYGERGAGPIPPNSELIFDIELLEIN